MKSAVCLALISFGLIASDALAMENERSTKIPAQKIVGQTSRQEPAASLLVINSKAAKLEGTKLILTGVSPNSIVFADRPTQAAGHLSTEDLIKQWDQGPDSFAVDPPNATISVLNGGSDISDAVVTLKSAALAGDTLTFDVTVLEGSLNGASGPAALFVDHWHGWNNAGWYGLGLATGAVAAAHLARSPHPVYAAPSYYDPYYTPSACPPGFWLGPWGDCRDTPYHGQLPNGAWQ
ncbi:hypothetical protein FZ934_25690 (plasmid) [Rhizobium grahamii]|uniref:Uncharacterized protein n=1 Tax=Rhizobium grahamii TaxID=1120045 RepID=A0A5Q0CHG0_9HYPH|nr:MULTISPECIES: hypothetical protein [Rhizobium]QFY63629.1 hypothetical protein FZ934_25690 [Rhizobium grahamii]QRM51605.1 hypothetical protein F3Y33_19955 [Rhizobium sp. BG6]